MSAMKFIFVFLARSFLFSATFILFSVPSFAIELSEIRGDVFIVTESAQTTAGAAAQSSANNEGKPEAGAPSAEKKISEKKLANPIGEFFREMLFCSRRARNLKPVWISANLV